jgi:4-hydroxyphenylacetate 3-monooxygenase
MSNIDRPFTGAEFLESVRDGREVWIYGQRVKDVLNTTSMDGSRLI